MNSEHIQRLSNGLQLYFKEKQNIDIVTKLGPETYRQTLMKAIRHVQNNNTNASIDAISRAAMQEARDMLLEASTPAPIVDPSQDFINRLSNLETQRKVEASPTDIIKPIVNPNPIQNMPSTLQNSLVIPIPDKRGRILPISSRSRTLTRFPQRSAFVWPGPIPTSNSTHVAIAAVQTPSFVLDITGFIVVHITGANESKTQCVLLPSASTTARAITWLPCSPATRFIKPVPTPWTLQLLNAFGERIDLGSDDITYHLNKGKSSEPNVGQPMALNEMKQWTIFLELEGTN